MSEENPTIDVRILSDETECLLSMKSNLNELRKRLNGLSDGALSLINDSLKLIKKNKEPKDIFEDVLLTYLSLEQLGKLWAVEIQSLLKMFPDVIVNKGREYLKTDKGFQELVEIQNEMEKLNSLYDTKIADIYKKN